jgi:hypothetical protein
VLCEDFVWPPIFACGWTEAVRLYELGSVIAVLTALDSLYVKSLDVPSWAQFLQILQDAGPAWMVAVLYGPETLNITTSEALKNLLTTTDPGGAVSVSGGLDVLARETVKCWKCGMLGYYARDCPKETGTGMHRSAPLNMLSAQESSQEHHTLIASLQKGCVCLCLLLGVCVLITAGPSTKLCVKGNVVFITAKPPVQHVVNLVIWKAPTKRSRTLLVRRTSYSQIITVRYRPWRTRSRQRATKQWSPRLRTDPDVRA